MIPKCHLIQSIHISSSQRLKIIIISNLNQALKLEAVLTGKREYKEIRCLNLKRKLSKIRL